MAQGLDTLGPTERRLLDYLVAWPDRVHRRETLLREVWADPGTGLRAVDAAVARLRRALGERGDAIVTVRRVGYRVDPARFGDSPASGEE